MGSNTLFLDEISPLLTRDEAVKRTRMLGLSMGIRKGWKSIIIVLLSIIGAFLIATNNGVGFILMMLYSSVTALTCFRKGIYWVAITQAIFFFSHVLGVSNSLF